MIARSASKAVLRRHQAHVARDRLDDDRGNLAGIGGKEAAHRLRIVVRRDQRAGRRSAGHAGAVRQAQRRHAAAGLHQQHVGVSVVVALELDDTLAPREGPGHAQRAHRRLRAAVDETDQLQPRHHLLHQRRQLDLQRAGRAEAGPSRRRFGERRYHTRVSVAEDQRPPREYVVEQRCRPRRRGRALGALDEQRLPADGAKARTGLLTPPGISRCACSYSSMERAMSGMVFPLHHHPACRFRALADQAGELADEKRVCVQRRGVPHAVGLRHFPP